MNTVLVDGVVWARQDELLDQLGDDVTPAMLRAWRRNRGLRSFRVGDVVWWDLQAAIECEARARESGRGRPRSTSG